MAPVKPKTPTRSSGQRMARKSATSKPSKSQPKKNLPQSLTRQIKTKPGAQAQKPAKKKRTIYTDVQLNLPVLNSIIPANAKTVQKAGGTGKKKGKVYVDDLESMTTILAMVNAEKEGMIEGKVQRERQMEEIREARRKEAEEKEKRRVENLEKVKGEVKKEKSGRRRRGGEAGKVGKELEKRVEVVKGGSEKERPKRKSVSFV